jgi:hypothetical protein
VQKSYHPNPSYPQKNKSADHQHRNGPSKNEYKKNIEKNSGDGIQPCGTPEDKERDADFTPSTSTTIERSRRNDETMPISHN